VGDFCKRSQTGVARFFFEFILNHFFGGESKWAMDVCKSTDFFSNYFLELSLVTDLFIRGPKPVNFEYIYLL